MRARPFGTEKYRNTNIWRHNPVGRGLMRQWKGFPYDKKDGLDSAHDLWEQVVVPPRPIKRGEPLMIPELARLLRDPRVGDERRLVDAAASVKLARW